MGKRAWQIFLRRHGRYVVPILVVLWGTYLYFADWQILPRGWYVDREGMVIDAVCMTVSGADEYGNFLPIAFRAFGEYKTPLLIYAYALAFFVFPANLLTARLIGVVLGWMGAGATTCVSFRQARFSLKAHPFLAALVFALTLLSSWLLVSQRTPFEMNLTVLATALAVGSGLACLRQPESMKYGIFAGFSAATLLYVYSATKLLALAQLPLIAIAWWLGREKPGRGLLWAAGALTMGAMPIIYDMTLGSHTFLARFQQVHSHGLADAIDSFFLHANPKFIFLKGDANQRHHTQFAGMMNVAFLPLLVLGLWQCCRSLWLRRNSRHIYLLGLLVVCFIPAALSSGSDIPHALRTQIAIVPLVMIAVLGLSCLWSWQKNWSAWPRRMSQAALALVFSLGMVEAYVNRQFYGEQMIHPERAGWTYYGPEAKWLDPHGKPLPLHTHGLRGVNERYFRVVEQKAYQYCDGYDAIKIRKL